jgi:hypothetical protein
VALKGEDDYTYLIFKERGSDHYLFQGTLLAFFWNDLMKLRKDSKRNVQDSHWILPQKISEALFKQQSWLIYYITTERDLTQHKHL